jgi:hypothetical protein
MLSKKVLLFGFLCCAVIAINARAFSDDMEVAASGKDEEWKKGGGKDHFEEEKSSHGDKGERMASSCSVVEMPHSILHSTKTRAFN